MHVFADFHAQGLAHIDRPVVTIGTFDGVHLGHERVLEALIEHARVLHSRPGILTFRVHPRKVLTGTGPLWLTSVPYRLRLFQAAGVDFTTFIPFSRELSMLSPHEFVEQILVGQLKVGGVVMGYDSCFGHKGSGTPELMEQFGRDFGFTVAKVPRVECNLVTTKLSSSAIREFIAKGDLAKAAQLLSRPYTLLGTVVQDQGRGAQLGFPTANLAHDDVLLPHTGVYATQVFIGPQAGAPADTPDGAIAAALGNFTGPHPAVTNIGVRPTVAPAHSGTPTPPTVESHLLDFSGDLYGRPIAVVFVERLREERKFAG
ncbi:MAG TPA: bifunctional riboflavin kinase/FMN adenylyltransferase, partial [Planctomycetota bacterium]|nr:bifunctional riboflavin kinase/FMN adenylyltransferase [Planctomycetota bacterium]